MNKSSQPQPPVVREIVTQQALKAYADQEAARMDKERADAVNGFRENSDDAFLRWYHSWKNEQRKLTRAKGGLPYLGIVPVGTSEIDLHPILPRDTEDQNGNARKEFTVSKPESPEQLAWTVNPRSPLYRDLLVNLTLAPCRIQLVRVGEGRTDTRYSVKFLKRL